jgi:hypothetical protein
MGAQTSKVARKLPTKARPETLQNVPKDSPATLEAAILAASGKKKLRFLYLHNSANIVNNRNQN